MSYSKQAVPSSSEITHKGSSIGFVLLLSCFSLVGYVLRMNISIAAALMLPELHLTKFQLGQIFSGFILGYTLFQIPWGLFGDRFGARSVLTIAALAWGITSFLTGLFPGLIVRAGFASFVVLYALRFLLGAGEAAGFPVAARAVASAMPRERHGFSYAAVITGTAVGSALTPPIVSQLMTRMGWRTSFYITSGVAIVLAIIWYFVAKENASFVQDDSAAEEHRQEPENLPWWELLSNPDIVLLCVSYFLESYVLYVFVFWTYLYLIEQRHFTLLSGGAFTGLPFFVAMFVIPAVGYLSDQITKEDGYKSGRRNIAILSMTFSALFLFLAVAVRAPYLAIAALSLSVTCLLSVECIFWSSSMAIGGHYAGTAGAIMNTAGNLGGIASTAMVPILLQHFGWAVAFGSSSVLVLCSALIWFKIRPHEQYASAI